MKCRERITNRRILLMVIEISIRKIRNPYIRTISNLFPL
jgi:hypothetical protein